ncbi:Pyroglutamyl-peptidase 1 [Coemansia interrupta]|uniref:Pyroglutamyl-peptidase 1 n=1 Tax=Coemansia interrupta TaxID=1126814 RepID=A0A9W8HKV9_9FUNG|nr:Pyroglutamyl-peptidase 1 [Coemansia interrupta]
MTKKMYALLTGFEPFGTPRPKDNRSWEAVKQLSGEVLSAGDETSVVCRCHKLPVSYDPVTDIVPRLHEKEDYAIVIHCGAGESGTVKLEMVAHKEGYQRPGNGGPGDVPRDGRVPGYDTADKLWTSVDVETCRSVLAEAGWTSVATSMDAGRYLCEFTYYTSLALSKTRYPEQGRVPPLVVFVHVPPKSCDPYSDRELADIMRRIVCFLAEQASS